MMLPDFASAIVSSAILVELFASIARMLFGFLAISCDWRKIEVAE
jgi:hypothetical protein